MKIIVAILVYNRFENIKTWVNCWKECEQNNAELIIIHNYAGESDRLKFEHYCRVNKIRYIARNGIGMDIGAFQDVCKERLPGFANDWDILLWCTDDTIPMQKDFLTIFLNSFKPGIGVLCMEISPFVRPHIRTTGFMINKELSKKLAFPADPITAKEECYQFEHRSENIFYNQVIKMGLKVVMVAPKERSPMWDMGYLRGLKRGAEHEQVFPKKNKVVFICIIYNSYPQIISSILCQNYSNWELIIIHDGPDETGVKKHVTDSRMTFIETKERAGKWGHSLRKWALEEVKGGRMAKDADFIVITNGDNYHAPSYCEYMVAGFVNKPDAVAVYCSDMVHNYIKWKILACRPARGFMDCAGVMVRKEIAAEVGWNDVETHSADWTYFEDIIKKYGVASFEKVTGCLLVHN